MATHHASPGEIVDLKTWANDLPVETSKAIVKTDELELIRLVLEAGDCFPENIIPGSVVIHCLSGEINSNAAGTQSVITAGQLLYSFSVEPNSIKAVSDSVVLMTVLLNSRIN